jgi:hypothetical protein
LGGFIWLPLFVAFGLLAKRVTLQLLRLRPRRMNRNVIIVALALLWIAVNAAHAYTFFHGSASNPYVKCITEADGIDDESICGDFYSKRRDRFEQDRPASR